MTNMNSEFVQYNCSNRIGNITLCRSEKRNALNSEFIEQLSRKFTLASKDNNCKIIVLKSEGTVFCAGADLEYLQSLQNNTYDDNVKDSNQLMELFNQIYKCEKLVIAKIQGHAIAGGCGLASVCDFSFASKDAKFGYTEVKIGFVPALVSVFLLNKLGETKAKELLLSGKLIDAKEAESIGLINKSMPSDKLDDFVDKFANEICVKNSSQSIKVTKDLISKVQNMTIDQGLKIAVKTNALAREHEDFKKGISSFLENKKINW